MLNNKKQLVKPSVSLYKALVFSPILEGAQHFKENAVTRAIMSFNNEEEYEAAAAAARACPPQAIEDEKKELLERRPGLPSVFNNRNLAEQRIQERKAQKKAQVRAEQQEEIKRVERLRELTERTKSINKRPNSQKPVARKL